MLQDWFREQIGQNTGLQSKILLTILVIGFFYLIRTILLRIVYKRIVNVKLRYVWRNSVTYTIIVIDILFVFFIWFNGLGEIAKFLGFISAGLVIALRDPIVNLVGWLYIIATSPYEVGHRVQIGKTAGDVVDIRPMYTIINEIGEWVNGDQATGRMVNIPNKTVFDEAQINYSMGFPYIWNEIHVLVTFESDWRTAKKLLYKVIENKSSKLSPIAKQELQRASQKFMVYYNNLNPKIYTRVVDSGVEFSIRYLVNPKRRRNSEEAIWEMILDEINKEDRVELAYNTSRIYFRKDEASNKELIYDKNKKNK